VKSEEISVGGYYQGLRSARSEIFIEAVTSRQDEAPLGATYFISLLKELRCLWTAGWLQIFGP
jgi:hypothetical protein